MDQRTLGTQGLTVSAIGLGCMSLGIAEIYSSSVHDDASALRLLHRALDLGANFLDTANIYGDSERKVGLALRGRRDQAVLATKFGIDRAGPADSKGPSERVNAHPDYVRACCDTSLQRLGVDVIDLYYQHRIDPSVPIEDTVGAMADLVRAGKVRYLGLSEAAPATLRRAHKVYPISALQTEYSLWSREPDDQILPTLRELGIGFVPYSPLGRGFLAGRFRRPDDLATNDWRRGSPRFQGENFAKNLAIAEQLRVIADQKGCTPSQLALAWLLAQGDHIAPIPGTSSLDRLEENLAAASIRLTAGDLRDIEAVAPHAAVVGQRYNAAGTQLLNR